MDPGDEDALRVEVLYSPQAGGTESVNLVLPPGSTVVQALVLSGLGERHPEVRHLLEHSTEPAALPLACGVWGRRCRSTNACATATGSSCTGRCGWTPSKLGVSATPNTSGAMGDAVWWHLDRHEARPAQAPAQLTCIRWPPCRGCV